MTPEHWPQRKELFQAGPPSSAPPQAAPWELRAGQMLGPYLVEHQLGQGGVGMVYQARDTRLGRPLALKLLPPQLTQDAERVQQFQQEARAASALNHPNILTIYESGETHATHFIATELVVGETLRNRLAAGPLPVTTALDIVLQVTSALVAAHQAGLLHRDLKPENIMIRPDGVVKVLDFGLAKLIVNDEGGGRRDESEKGDPPIPPSSFLPHPSADACADLFSVGVVLSELLTGHPPFTGETASEVLAAVMEREPASLAQQQANLPLELQRIVQRALAKSVAARYQTASELLDDLKRLKQALDVSAHLREASSEAETVTWTAAQAQDASPARPRARLLWGGALVLLLAVGVWLLPFRKTTSPLNSLAVLPFVNVANDPQLEYLADGLTESLIDSLMRLSSLRIKARSMVFGYKGRTVDPRQVGKELGVQAVVVGRVQQQGERPLIRAELIDTADGSQLWSRDYQVPLTSLLAVQEEIAREVVTRLQLSLSQQEQSVLARSQTNSATAYNLFLDGRHHWSKRTRDGITRAVELFQQAIAQDPNYALAYVGLADAYSTLGSYHIKPAKDAYPLARAAAEKAIQLDDKLGEAHATMGKIITDYYWQWPEAERAFQRAITLNPKYANGYHWYSTMLVQQGRFDEAIRAARQALELESASVILQRQLGYVLYSAGRYDEAIAALQKALALEPTHVTAQFYLGDCFLLQGKSSEALAAFEKANALIPNLPDVLAALGYTQAALGNRAAALRYQTQLQEMMPQRYVPPYCIATVALGLGQLDDVFAWLEKGYEERDPHIRGLLTDPLYERVRKEPRFVALLRKAGLVS